MSLHFGKITDAMVNVIRELPNRPTGTGYMTAAQLKAKFDEAAENIKACFNNLIDDLQSSSAAASIGFARTTGVAEDTVQAAIVNVQSQIAGVSQGAVADGSITAAKLDADAFDWTLKLEEPEDYSESDYTSNGLCFFYCQPLKLMRVEGWVRFTPTSEAANLGYCYARFALPTPVPEQNAVPMSAGVIKDPPRLNLIAKAEIRQGSYLDVYLGGTKLSDRGNSFEVWVHGFYLCQGASE